MKAIIPILFAALAIFASNPASAACVGSAAFQTCTDAAGNSYTVNRLGNSTMMNGRNARTGTTWNQTSTTYGNTTMHTGSTNGKPWNLQTNTFGNTTTYSGRNSAGKPIYGTYNNK